MPTENKLPSVATGHDLNQWKLVPVEPTETMVINGFESEPDECFSDEEVWEQYQEMSGCQQAAFRAKQCWAAMLAAAPTPPQPIYDEAKERELFESWYGDVRLLSMDGKNRFMHDQDGTYWFIGTRKAWSGWLACAQSRAKAVEVDHE
jgi:hypothetical protein